LKDIISGGGKKLIRPQTAATSTKKDEDRIKKQLKYLEHLEEKIEKDLANFSLEGPTGDEKKVFKKGVIITKKMLLDASQAEEIHEIQSLLLRDKNIE
jgi:ribosome-binding ATPase YchF (GTP1/OBG family)